MSDLYNYQADIVKVIDGNTCDASISCGFYIYHHIRLRLNGINTPELHSKVKTEVAAALKAKTRLAELIEGKTVTVRTFRDKTEKYGRFLAEIDLDGVNINQQMIDEGLAVAYNGGKRT